MDDGTKNIIGLGLGFFGVAYAVVIVFANRRAFDDSPESYTEKAFWGRGVCFMIAFPLAVLSLILIAVVVGKIFA